MLGDFLRQILPLLAVAVGVGLIARLLLALPGRAWRRWRRRRQRPLSAYPAHVLEAAWRFDARFRDQLLQRGTASRDDIDQGIARSLVLVEAELRSRR